MLQWKKILTCFLLLLFFSLNTEAIIIKGKVIDESTKKALHSVKIDVLDSTLIVFTNRKGEYAVYDLPSGTYVLKIHQRGFMPIESKVILGKTDVYTEDFYLIPDRLLTHEIVVTATKTNYTVGNVPVDAEVITAREIQEKNIINVQDVFEYISGTQVRQTSGSWGNKGSIRLQGLNGEHTLVLVNGQKYKGGHSEGVDISSIPINMIEKIEVVKGPASVLYGSDAVGGVVNIITKSSLDQKSSVNISTGYGSDNYQVYEAMANYSKNKFGAQISFGKKHTDALDEETDDMDEDIVSGNFEYRFSKNLKVSINPRYEYNILDSVNSKDEKDNRIQKRFSLNSLLEWKSNKGSIINLRASLFNYKHYMESKSTDYNDNTYELELTATHLLTKNHLLTAGYHFENQQRDDRGKEFEIDQSINSFYLQDQISLNPFIFVIGARMDLHEAWGTEFNPKANVMLDVTDNLKLRASAGRAFRAPTLLSLYAPDWKMGPYTVISNPDLKPEKSLGLQIGGEWQLAKKVIAGVSYFHNDIKNLITSKIDRSGRPWKMTYNNVDEAMTQGVELNLRASLAKNLITKVGYTLLDTEDKTTGEELLERPKNSLFLGFTWNFEKIGAGFTIDGFYIGKRYAIIDDEDTIGELDPHVTFNVSLSKSITRYGRLFIRIINIFDKQDVYDEYNIRGTKLFAGLELNF